MGNRHVSTCHLPFGINFGTLGEAHCLSTPPTSPRPTEASGTSGTQVSARPAAVRWCVWLLVAGADEARL